MPPNVLDGLDQVDHPLSRQCYSVDLDRLYRATFIGHHASPRPVWGFVEGGAGTCRQPTRQMVIVSENPWMTFSLSEWPKSQLSTTSPFGNACVGLTYVTT